MKDRQAELESNIVADHLASFYKKIEPYSKLVLGAVVLVVVAFTGYALYSSGQLEKRSDATLQLLMENPDVPSLYPETSAAAWSLLFQGDDSLAQGIDALYRDRDEAETLLAQAKSQFAEAAVTTEDKYVRSRAGFGLGMACESLGEIDEAVKAYEKVVAANESEQIVEVANERIGRLGDSQDVDFLAWFSDQDFSPADPSLPPELPGSQALPDLPDIDLPDLDFGDSMNAGERSDEDGAGLNLPDASDQGEAEATDAPASEQGDAAEPADSAEQAESAEQAGADADTADESSESSDSDQ